MVSLGFRDSARNPGQHQRMPQQDWLAANLSEQLYRSEVVRKASPVIAGPIRPEPEADARLDGRRSSGPDRCEGQLKPALKLPHQRQFAPQPLEGPK